MNLFQWDSDRVGIESFICNSPLWEVVDLDGRCLTVMNNKDMDEVGGNVAIFGDPEWTDVAVSAEMRGGNALALKPVVFSHQVNERFRRYQLTAFPLTDRELAGQNAITARPLARTARRRAIHTYA